MRVSPSLSPRFFCSCWFSQGLSGCHREMSLHALWKCQGLGSTLNCFWGLPHFSCPHRTRPFILGTLGCARKSRLLVALCLVPLFVDYESMNFFKIVSLCYVSLRTNAFLASAICNFCGTHCPMTGWVCQWKPLWIPVDDSFKKAYVGEWVFQVTDTSDLILPEDEGDLIPETPRRHV